MNLPDLHPCQHPALKGTRCDCIGECGFYKELNQTNMNKNALTKKSNRKVVTATGKIPDSTGFPGRNSTGGGVIFRDRKKK